MYKKLLKWYEKNKRPLPWRENPTPYAVLVAEIMAQQTRMDQLLPFYTRFVAAFPTLEALAASNEEAVLAAWAGMGYYARARNLHRAAREIREQYGESWPATRRAWEALPGIGAYTAGAVLSIAFGQKEAAVDGNVLRLYARLANDSIDIKTPTAKTRAAEFVLANMPGKASEISLYTQALMEMGALVCTPQNPKCETCPLSAECAAYAAGRERDLPVKAKKKQSPVIEMTVLLVIAPDGRVLMRKRTEKLLQDMYVYYLIEESLCDFSEQAVFFELEKLGYTVSSIVPIGEARHVFTHRVWQMHGYAVYVNECHEPEGFRLFSRADIQNAAVPLPAAMKYFTQWYVK